MIFVFKYGTAFTKVVFSIYKNRKLFSLFRTEVCDFASENEPKIDDHNDDHLRNEAYAKLGLKKVHSNEECT